MTFNLVHIFAKSANPFLTHLYKLNEWIDISSALFATDDRLVVEISQRNRLARRQLTVWFHNNCQRDTRFFSHLGSAWNAVCCDSQN